MDKKVKIRIFPDGKIKAEIEGIQGKSCTNYIKIIEELLNAETYDSKPTSEYYKEEDVVLEIEEKESAINKRDV